MEEIDTNLRADRHRYSDLLVCSGKSVASAKESTEAAALMSHCCFCENMTEFFPLLGTGTRAVPAKPRLSGTELDTTGWHVQCFPHKERRWLVNKQDARVKSENVSTNANVFISRQALHRVVSRAANGRKQTIKRGIHMPTLLIDEREQQLLLELLDNQRRELLHEIHHTDDRNYRQGLKEREDVVEALLKKLQTAS